MDALLPGRIVTGDAVELIGRVAPGSVALVVFSPPYLVGKSYESHLDEAGWVAMLGAVIAGCARALKPGGFMAVNINDVLAWPDPQLPRFGGQNTAVTRPPSREAVLAAQAANPGVNRYALARMFGVSEQTIHRRLGGTGVRGGKKGTQTRVRLAGPDLDRLARAAGLFLYDRRVWVKSPSWTGSPWHPSSYRCIDDFEYVYVFQRPGPFVVDRSRLSPDEWAAWGSRGVWSIRSVDANDDHEAKYPIELPRRIIRIFSAPGDVVVDPFVGSGTTALTAAGLGRRWLGFEIDPEAADLARRTLSSSASAGQQQTAS